MKTEKVWRVFYTSIARVHAATPEEALDRAHRVAGAALKQARKVTPELAPHVDIENIDMVSAEFCGTEEVPKPQRFGTGIVKNDCEMCLMHVLFRPLSFAL